MIKQIRAVLETYSAAKNPRGGVDHSHIAVTSMKELAAELRDMQFIKSNENLTAKESVGSGRLSAVPWVAILDDRVAPTPKVGTYPVFLFKADMSGFYLSLCMATGIGHGKLGKKKTIELATQSKHLAIHFQGLSGRAFSNLPRLSLAVTDGLGVAYEAGSIVHKFFPANSLPDESILVADIRALVQAYEDAISTGVILSSGQVSADEHLTPSGVSGELLDSIQSDFTEACVVCQPSRLTQCSAALLSKRFLILTGLAGSGKTKIAQAFARWITPQAGATKCYEIVPVGADWTGSESVLGYPDGLASNIYVTKPSLDLILHAEASRDIPHFLILDEMNLSHVERYFADILSVIESEECLQLYSGDMTKRETWRRTVAGTSVPPEIRALPRNLFIIGTVNVDETTYMFSPKVLDRANVIEFRMNAVELDDFLTNPTKPNMSKLDGKGASFGKAFVDAAASLVSVPDEVKSDYDSEMLLFFKVLQGHGSEFGYRTAYETTRFIYFYKLLGNHSSDEFAWFSGAFDCVVVQKILPKLHGSRSKLAPVLKKLWFLCVNDRFARGGDPFAGAEDAGRSPDKNAEPTVSVPDTAPYPLSAEKISRMWKLLIENGFASFAEA
jgi:5-methylcytosine-specific restriction protein B